MATFIPTFEEATRDGILVKMALTGAPGSGKTFTALALAAYLSKTLDLGDVFVIDSENRSSKKYVYDPKTQRGWKFKALYMPKDDYSPQTYMKAIHAAENAGARIIIIDSISHAWSGVKGILEQVDELTDKAAKDRGKSYGNSFSDGWRKATPLQNEFVQSMLDSHAHIIVTMRSDPEWVLDGKTPVKVGMAPKQRKDITFEFDVVLDCDQNNTVMVSKTRCQELNDGNGVFKKPNTDKIGAILSDWVKTSDDVATKTAPTTVATKPAAVNADVDPSHRAPDPAHRALADDLCQRIGQAPDNAALDLLRDEIKQIDGAHKQRVLVTLLFRRIAVAQTSTALDEIAARVTVKAFGERDAMALHEAIKGKRIDLDVAQEPAAASVPDAAAA